MTNPPRATVTQEGFAPCPTCGQYSHSIGGDQLAEAFRHFETMFSHRGDGIPTQFVFGMETRDAAQILMAAARHREQALALARSEAIEESEQAVEAVAMAIALEIGWGSFSHFDPNDARRISRAAIAALRNLPPEQGEG